MYALKQRHHDAWRSTISCDWRTMYHLCNHHHHQHCRCFPSRWSVCRKSINVYTWIDVESMCCVFCPHHATNMMSTKIWRRFVRFERLLNCVTVIIMSCMPASEPSKETHKNTSTRRTCDLWKWKKAVKYIVYVWRLVQLRQSIQQMRQTCIDS